MGMRNDNKTTPTDASVDSLMNAMDERRQAETKQLCDIMQRVSGKPPVVWGSNIIGFGSYHYISKSGREGDWAAIGFRPSKAKISLYLSCDADEFADELAQLGKHTRGVGCVYVNKLADVDLTVLERMIQKAYNATHDYDARQEKVT